MICNDTFLEIPAMQRVVRPGDIVRLGRFDNDEWIVQFGWYAYAGNREVCGWYLINKDDPSKRKPFSKPDLDDCYFVET